MQLVPSRPGLSILLWVLLLLHLPLQDRRRQESKNKQGLWNQAELGFRPDSDLEQLTEPCFPLPIRLTHA